MNSNRVEIMEGLEGLVPASLAAIEAALDPDAAPDKAAQDRARMGMSVVSAIGRLRATANSRNSLALKLIEGASSSREEYRANLKRTAPQLNVTLVEHVENEGEKKGKKK